MDSVAKAPELNSGVSLLARLWPRARSPLFDGFWRRNAALDRGSICRL